ncbi:polysaccharide pyruvyl transferase family protein [Planctellipticum variicoloris]|uniref:polysaccharide pyruvyl transferase family protein n=1 Tax=Planctellipticum variicoloris TaxID=3064265 RepID=UPI003013A4CB|nr:polysaccharide pyruvyl transferase family protein [Planctomycetaceae bacterium SH412]
MQRRTFLQTLAATLAGPAVAFAAQNRPQRILLRSSWQTVNIGDIGHTPGVLALLERHLPGAEVRLWPSDVRNGVAELLQTRFPKVPLMQGQGAIKTAFQESDFLLHGSGPSLVAAKDVQRWSAETGKPYGVFGITLPSAEESVLKLLSDARFVFFRDSVSLQLAKDKGCTCPVMEFGPDGAFAVDLRNDAAAEKFLAAHRLEVGKFLCCIPRLRYTPYWKIKDRPFDAVKHARNEAMKEHDHAPLREAIIAVTRQTDCKVLLCPEDQSQMAVGKELLFDPLPDDVKGRVVWRENYWLTDEAVSTYVRSAGLFGLEMHSPIMCIGNGVPALVGRFAEQTSKGFMWRDIGLEDWLFDMDQPADVARIVPAVLSLAQDPAAAKAKAAEARERVRARQEAMAGELSRQVAMVQS